MARVEKTAEQIEYEKLLAKEKSDRTKKLEDEAELMLVLSSKAKRVVGMYFRQAEDVQTEIKEFLNTHS